MTRYLFRFAHLVHAFLGLALGLLVYLIDVYTPETVHPILWIILTIVLIVNGLLLGRMTRRLYLNGYLDNLTGLGNKGFFYLQLRLEMSQVKDQLSLAMMDVDNFKKINDNYGHPAGDIVLKDLAKILKQNVRKIDTVVRWGGEEFAIILPQTSQDGASKLLERIRGIIESHDFGTNVNSSKVTVSVGVVSFRDLMDIENPEELHPTDLFVNLADKALYKTKETKNAVIKWNLDCNNIHSYLNVKETSGKFFGG